MSVTMEQCAICYREFKGQAGLNIHIAKMHLRQEDIQKYISQCLFAQISCFHKLLISKLHVKFL